jgi:hypothetical protein
VAPVAQPGWPTHRLLGEKQLSLFLADTKFPILGADFLRHHCLVVDLAAGRLNNTDTLQQLGSAVSSPGAGGLLASVQATPSPFRSLFSEFQEEANPSGTFVQLCTVLHLLCTERHQGKRSPNLVLAKLSKIWDLDYE